MDLTLQTPMTSHTVYGTTGRETRKEKPGYSTPGTQRLPLQARMLIILQTATLRRPPSISSILTVKVIGEMWRTGTALIQN